MKYVYSWAQHVKMTGGGSRALSGSNFKYDDIKACVADAPDNDYVKFFRKPAQEEVDKNGDVK